MKAMGSAIAVSAIALLSMSIVGGAAETGPAGNVATGEKVDHGDAAASIVPESGENFDCIMEPYLTIKLGSSDTGIIEKLNVDRGDLVKPGEVVATLDSQMQQLAVRMARLKVASNADLKSEEARLAYREAAAQRNEVLHQKSFVSTKDYDKAMVERQLAALALQKARDDHLLAQEELAQAEARLDRRSIRSPVGGVVVDITSEPGEYVYDQTPVMTIADINPLYVRVFLPVEYYRRITVGTVADVRPDQPIGGVYRARVSVVDKVFDPASSTFRVRLKLPNPNNTLPGGVRCRLHFLIEGAARGPVTPAVPPGAAHRAPVIPDP